MRRTRRRTQKDTSERWLLTYADLITLLMIFFVIMFAMSQINQVKFNTLRRTLAEALQHSSQPPMNPGTTSLLTSAGTGGVRNGSPTDQTEVRPDRLDHLYQQVRQYIQEHNLQHNVQIVDQARGIQITLRDIVLFDTGQATLKSDARGLLDGLVPFMQRIDSPIVIEGYTDNQPISTPNYPTNWELSSARAIGIVRFLSTQGIGPSRLSAVGYGQYHPEVPNDTPAHRQENRRVNIVILRQS